MEQVSLLDEALERVEANAAAAWRASALRVIHRLALERDDFTADDVWEALDTVGNHTPERRALGPLMQRAASRGWIRPTAMYRPTSRPEAPHRPVKAWASKLAGWQGW